MNQYTSTTYGFTEELTEENFYVPAEAEYEDFGEETEEYDAASSVGKHSQEERA